MNEDYVMIDESSAWYVVLWVLLVCNIDKVFIAVTLLDLLF